MEKRTKWIIFSVVMLVLTLILISAVAGYNILHSDKDEDNIVKDNVKIIKAETDNQPVSVEDDQIIFDSNPGYKKEDVIVSGSTASSPNGFIRKVVQVKKTEGRYIIKTKPAVLTDVFEKAHIYKRIELTEDQTESMSYNIENGDTGISQLRSPNILCESEDEEEKDDDSDYMFKKSFEEKKEPVTISGEAGTSAWIELSIDIEHRDIKCGIAVRTEEGAKASMECNASYSKELEKQLLKKQLPNFQFTVSGIPIVVTNELEIYAETDTKLEGNVDVSYELTAETTQGFQYNSKTGKVKEINEITCDSDGVQWSTTSVKGDASVGSSVHLITKLYDASGMDMSLNIAGKADGEAKVSNNKKLAGYAGSLDLSLVPEVKGEVVVDAPVFHENLLRQTLFEKSLKPLWKKHWESSKNWKKDLKWTEEQGRIYVTRYSEVHNVPGGTFQFYIPAGWKVKSEEVGKELDVIEEKVVITNKKGITITYWDTTDKLGGYSRSWLRANITKMADSEFRTDIGTDGGDYQAKLGKMIVAKVHITGEMYMGLDEDYSDVDSVIYAVVPESYIGKREFAGQAGFVDEFSFDYPTPHAFIAESKNGKFTTDEEKQVVRILKSFK